MTTVASYSGVYPSHILDPLVRGVPAMKMLSFIAILLPESNPVHFASYLNLCCPVAKSQRISAVGSGVRTEEICAGSGIGFVS